MANVFNSQIKINEQYDLKGSTLNRHVSTDDPEVAKKDLDFHHRINLGSSRKALILEQLEKDTYWLQSKNICDYSLLVGIYFSSTEKMSNKLCIQEDQEEISIFKKHFGGMLSIVDAVEYFEQTSKQPTNTEKKDENTNNNKNETEEEKYKKWEYATIAMNQRGHSMVIIYTLGLIDVLTYYDLKKMGEHTIKSIRYGSQGLSAIPSKPYRVRFMKYVSSIID
jgi:hypothetical protein